MFGPDSSINSLRLWYPMAEQNSGSVEQDCFHQIFTLQERLNDYVFAKNGLRDNEGETLRMATIIQAAANGERSVNDLPNLWLARYSKAMAEELAELDQDLLWKWWSKDSIDLQNIRIELIDILHFLISAMMCAGLTPEKVHEIYRQKNELNIARQNADYSQKTKSEDDNRSIQ
jgi:dimeric dUTPase (all-alpha-NTP-PPase superfamily)